MSTPLQRKRNKSSPLIDISPKKHRNYSPLQGQPESKAGCFSDSDTESEPSICPSLQTMLSPEQSQSQSLLGGAGPNEPNEALQGPSQGHPLTQDGNMQGIHQPHQPHFINPMMIGSPMNPGILAFPGMQQGTCAIPPPPSLSDQDIIKIAGVIKQLLSEEINHIVSLKVDSATQSLKSEITHVQNRCDNLEREISDLKLKNDEMEQYSRRMCLRIAGIKEGDKEDVPLKVIDFASNLQIDIAADDIDRAHRVGRPMNTTDSNNHDQATNATSNQSREIIVKFTNSSARLRFLHGRTKLREKKIKNVYINEDLTPGRKELAYECRKLKRTSKSNIQKTWIYAGYPHILDNLGKKVKITCMADLDSYKLNKHAPPSAPL